ncbi:MAG: 3-deoxy-7-phosphoheptulonate synthase [bacterium]|nr:3-deoxy-7-phosphoheptulonate synthase [bacterium]
MFLTLKQGTTEEGKNHILDKIKELGFKAHISEGENQQVIGVIGNNVIAKKEIFESMFMVDSVTPISKSYKLVSKEFKEDATIVDVGKGVKVGSDQLVVMSGPCSIDREDNLLATAKAVKASGANVLRAGAFKPRTSPYAFRGLGLEGLKMLQRVGDELKMPTVSEAMTINQAIEVAEYSDIIQVGARNAQNFDLLRELGKLKKPVLLKRGIAMTMDEFFMSAEYIASEGNTDIILCERGIRTFETATRFTLDLNAVPVVKKFTHLPIIIDPSHGTGVREYVKPMCMAAMASGADGVMVEVHPIPEEALSDGPQSLVFDQFEDLMKDLKKISQVVGKK